MPVNTPSSAYTESAPRVKRVRDCAEGQDAVKDAGTLYLPQLSGQDDYEYDAYKNRGYVIPVVKPTASALTGAIMRKAPSSELPENLEYLIENSDGEGKDLSILASDSCSELMLAGRYGYLGETLESGVAIKAYSRESIINWSDDYIVLSQNYMVQDPKDKFKQVSKVEYLELTFDENGLYIQNIWREGNGKKYGIDSTLEPSINGTRLDKLPFEFINTMDATPILTDPALLHLSDVNLDQYRLSTDLRHGLHWTALPTLFLFGEVTDSKGKQVKIAVGAGTSNHIQDSEARVELLEFTGAGLSAISAAIDEDIETMGSIGARLLVGKSSGVKATETVKIEQSGETATLSTIAQSVENGITNILKTLAEWSGMSGDIVYSLNKDFIDATLSPQELSVYLQALQSEAISQETFLNLLHRGELLPKGISVEDEIALLDAGGSDFNDDTING